MKVLVFGASGIIGQHLRLCVPPQHETAFYRREEDPITEGTNLMDSFATDRLLDREKPDVVVNLAGGNSPDNVQTDEEAYRALNVMVPGELAEYCEAKGSHYIHVSSQAVFGGGRAPYRADSKWPIPEADVPVNCYGYQKLQAESMVMARRDGRWSIVRPTFILGIRPLPHCGRENPVEAMLAGKQPKQVADRWFSPLLAEDAAQLIWRIATERPRRGIIHLGEPRRINRYDIANLLGVECEPCKHVDFPDLAPRPIDTTYAEGSQYIYGLEQGLGECRAQWEAWKTSSGLDRAREMALFFGIREAEARDSVMRGFADAHAAVARDFRRANPQTPDDLLTWYRITRSYIPELSAYHTDPGFNYMGMCRGITERLKALGVKRVLCLADGIGDLTLSLRRAGIGAVYNDLDLSITAAYACFRYWRQTGEYLPRQLSADWKPDIQGPWDAIVSVDFLEHVPNVEDWARAIHAGLAPGGWFVAQNAFGLGSGPQGSIPMHLQCNDRYEKEWDPLLFSLGFRQEGPQWYQNI